MTRAEAACPRGIRPGEPRPRMLVPICVIALCLTFGLCASACSDEGRDRVQGALSGASGLPTAIPSRTGTIELPTAGPTGPTATETEEPTTEPTHEPTSEPTEAPTTETTPPPIAEPTEGPGGEHGDLIVAIVAIIRRLLEGVPQPPTESPSPTKPPKPTESPEPTEAPEPTESPETTESPEESPTGATESPTGPTGSTAPIGPTGTTGIAAGGGATGPTGDDQAAEEIVSAAVSNSSQDTWIWVVALVLLVGIGWFTWSRTRRWRSGSPPPSDEPTSSPSETTDQA